jgi:hypothetical protein
MATRVRRLPAVALLVALCPAAPHVLAQDDAAAALVARAGRYVLEYERQFTGLVGEEHQTQRLVKPNGTVSKTRSLVSDILLVESGGRMSFFRDVIEVDGKAVRNRDERLRTLFASQSRGAVEQARAIIAEGARFDLAFPHLRGILILPLLIVKAPISERFRFGAADSGVTFEEIKTPDLVTYHEGRRVWSAPLTGRMAIDEDGRLRSATLAWAAEDLFAGTMDVRYEEDEASHLLVPAELKEAYRRPARPKDDHLEIVSTYSNYRRFEVQVDEQIERPQ